MEHSFPIFWCQIWMLCRTFNNKHSLSLTWVFAAACACLCICPKPCRAFALSQASYNFTGYTIIFDILRLFPKMKRSRTLELSNTFLDILNWNQIFQAPDTKCKLNVSLALVRLGMPSFDSIQVPPAFNRFQQGQIFLPPEHRSHLFNLPR